MADYFIAPLEKLKEFTQYKLKPKIQIFTANLLT